MTDEIVVYTKNRAIATITLNRPDKANTILPETMYGISASLRKANLDDEVKVIILEGAGDNFCGWFDFSNGLEHTPMVKEEDYDPGRDVHVVTDPYHDYMPTFMGLHRGGKPTIAKAHGYCVGGGSELALCADLVIASDDARFGTPYSRVWGCHLSGM
jgi:enoyl-CoA hydratase